MNNRNRRAPYQHRKALENSCLKVLTHFGHGSLRDRTGRKWVREIVLSEMYVTIPRSADMAVEVKSVFFELPIAVSAVTRFDLVDWVSGSYMQGHDWLSTST